MTEDEKTEALEDALVSPQSSTVDGQSATARSAADMIALDRYLRTTRRAKRGWDAVQMRRATIKGLQE